LPRKPFFSLYLHYITRVKHSAVVGSEVSGKAFRAEVELGRMVDRHETHFSLIRRRFNLSETTRKPTVKKTTVKASAKAEVPAKVAAAKPAARKTVAKKAAPAVGPQLVPALTHEQIAKRAYELWAGRGYVQGDPVHDWWQAEQELKRA